MITKISMNKVASYKTVSNLETDKKVNLIYGLNGYGKSTISNFLYNRSHNRFENCLIEGITDEEILVYNQKFIEEYFHTEDGLKGIFTLAKENKDMISKIKSAEIKIESLKNEKEEKEKQKTECEQKHNLNKQIIKDNTWSIKQKYAGGDRILTYCFNGLMKEKEALLNHLLKVQSPLNKPTIQIEELKKEIELISGDNSKSYDFLSEILTNTFDIESNIIFQEIIIGNNNSVVAGLIKRLGNSDWVKQGLEYISKDITGEIQACPFCQGETIDKSIVESIYNYFDEHYEKSLEDIKELLNKYETYLNSIPNIREYYSNIFIKNKDEFQNLYNSLLLILNENKKQMQEKLKKPNSSVTLESSKLAIDKLNNFIKEVNFNISAHNNKINNKNKTLESMKNKFWEIIYSQYEPILTQYKNQTEANNSMLKKLDKEIITINGYISEQTQFIKEYQKNTVNIEEAITNINTTLIDLGIDGFFIEKYQENMYRIVREEDCNDTFYTLSEGEKMIISFLYFKELCKGKKEKEGKTLKKIIVIDDPISSLSHIYVFNIGQFIKKEYLNSNEFEQIFILTHNLYFFYEMSDTNHIRRKENQKLFRLLKNSEGSKILEMKYEEVQNDYQSYWYIVKDENHPPALIANCMRNIIEYFFNFIEKKDLNNIFQKPSLQDNKYQAFYRYINRESHSLGQNIFDYKEFDYTDFKEAFCLVFTESGYKEHFELMMRQ